MILLDTCALLEICRGKPAMKPSLLQRIEKEGAVILSISFAEIACKVAAGKLSLGGITYRAFHDRLKETELVEIVDIGPAEWFDAIELNWDHRDPADRMLVSYARARGLEICSSDKKIRDFYPKTSW